MFHSEKYRYWQLKSVIIGTSTDCSSRDSSIADSVVFPGTNNMMSISGHARDEGSKGTPRVESHLLRISGSLAVVVRR